MMEATSRWTGFASSAWCVAFGAPHLWWALGWSFGFPGGQASYDFFMSSWWHVAYDWFVIACCLLGVFVALALNKPAESVAQRAVSLTLAWTAFVLLSLRGVAGLIVDRFQDLIWNPTFVVGGVLFGALVWQARRSK
jgi:hypothetical protein